MKYLVALLGLAAATASFAQPQQDPRGLRVVALVPVPLEEGISEFHRICMASDFEADRFDEEIRRSKWRFREEAGFGTPRPRILRAPEALLMFHARPVQETRAFAPGQCNMNFAVPASVTKDEILHRLATAVGGLATARLQWRELRGETCARWIVAGAIRRVCLIGSAKEMQQVSLSFQLWTPAGEARARLKPE